MTVLCDCHPEGFSGTVDEVLEHVPMADAEVIPLFRPDLEPRRLELVR